MKPSRVTRMLLGAIADVMHMRQRVAANWWRVRRAECGQHSRWLWQSQRRLASALLILGMTWDVFILAGAARS